MLTDPVRAPACPACREITGRSDLYERWFFAESFGDGATLEAIAAARGFCSPHARRVLGRDPAIAAPVARFVLRTLSTQAHRQQGERRGYRDALSPQALCPWCASEREALEYVVTDVKRRRGALCAPHARAVFIMEKRGVFVAEPPFLPGEPLDPLPASVASASGHSWWSPTVGVLWESLRASCPACSTALEAGRRRERFLRAGPQPGEHWDVPTLCVAHDAALANPSAPACTRAPDAVTRECDWCAAMHHVAHRTEELFAAVYRDAQFRLAYAAVPGLCLPHAAGVLARLSNGVRDDFARATLLRIDTAAWELEERALRTSWNLRDQGELPHSSDLAHRAWWLIAGGVRRTRVGGIRS